MNSTLLRKIVMIKAVANLGEEEYLSIPNRRSTVNEFYRYEFMKVDTKGSRRVVNISLDVYGSVSSHHALELATGLKAKKYGEHQMELIITKDHTVQTMTYFHNKADMALMGNTDSLRGILNEFLLFLTSRELEDSIILLIDMFHVHLGNASRDADSCSLINLWFDKLDSTEPLLGYPPTFTIFELFHNHRDQNLHGQFKNVLMSKLSLNQTLELMASFPIGKLCR